MTTQPLTFLVFASGKEAREYRHTTGCGGWIFIADDDEPSRHYSHGRAIIFPPEMPPSAVMMHPICIGRPGILVGQS